MSEIPAKREFWNGVLQKIASRTSDRENAEDLLHTAYLRLERYRINHKVESTAGFLTQTAMNIRVDNHRRDNFLRRHALETSQSINYHAPLQDEVMIARDRLRRLSAGLEQLTPRTREVFLLHRFEELKYREIAVQLKISQSAVEKHIAKAASFLGMWMKGW